jgi:hypothetical protein
MLMVATSLEEHVRQLSEVLAGDEEFAQRNRRFLEEFVRPHGLERPAAPILADVLERAAATGTRR